MTDPLTVDRVRQRLRDDWDPDLFMQVANDARATVSLDSTVDALEAVYDDVVRAWQPPTPEVMAAWVRDFLVESTAAWKLGHEVQARWRARHPASSPVTPIDAIREQGRIMGSLGFVDRSERSRWGRWRFWRS